MAASDRNLAWAEELERFSTAYLPFIHFHAVVAQELLAGSIDQRREKLVEDSLIQPFERRRRVLVPSFAAWKSAGGCKLFHIDFGMKTFMFFKF